MMLRRAAAAHITRVVRRRCCTRFSLSIGPTRTEPLFQGQSLKLIHARAERHAGKAPQHGDMLDVGLDGAEDT